MLDPASIDTTVFEASALLAGLQIPIIAVLIELYSRTKDEVFVTGLKLSAVSSLVFLVVSIYSLFLLLQMIWTPYPAISLAIVILLVGALFLIVTVLMTAGVKLVMRPPGAPPMEPMDSGKKAGKKP